MKRRQNESVSLFVTPMLWKEDFYNYNERYTDKRTKFISWLSIVSSLQFLKVYREYVIHEVILSYSTTGITKTIEILGILTQTT